ncbi:radical SAM protein [bacterium]|nr:MAG: radical SAM protein [bacterium]
MDLNASVHEGTKGGCKTLREIKNARVYIRTFGCTYNHGDTRKLIEVLIHQGCTISDSPDGADVIIINSCTVVESTARKVLRLVEAYSDSRLYITGCMPAVEAERILAVCNPAFITPDCIHEVYHLHPVIHKSTTGIVQVARGCLGSCSYCITKNARGRLVSFPGDEIIGQIRQHIDLGAVEIQITAQDISAWGYDTGESLPDLLATISMLGGEFRARIGMMNPSTLQRVMPKILSSFEEGKIFRFIHMPIQSGSDTILERMRRGYTVSDCISLIDQFRGRFPDITIMTDMIVGFPGESEEDFLKSLDLIRKIKPNKVNITRFSKRNGTGMEGVYDFTDYIKKKRSRTMNTCAEAIYHSINIPWIGKTVPFIVTEKIREGSVVARTPSYQGVILKEDLPLGMTGEAILTSEKMYFFVGSRV